MTNLSIMRWLGVLAFIGTAFVVGCGGDDDGDGTTADECPEPGDAALAQGQQVLIMRCNSCHSSTATGAARGGAPVGVDFDTQAGIDQYAARIKARSEANTMPPGGGLSATEIENLGLHVDCGL